MLLGTSQEALRRLTTATVHPVYFPYLWAPSIHAARISIGFQANARASKTTLSWSSYIVGYLIMAWAGTFITNFLLGLPPPPLYSLHPYINYVGIHLVLSVVFGLFPSALNPPLIDTVLFPLDALIRTNSVASSLSLLKQPTVNPLLSTSPVTPLIIGAIASAGGSTTAATFGVWGPGWTLNTPPFLKGSDDSLNTFVRTVDVWGGSLIAFIYSIVTADPAYAPSNPVAMKIAAAFKLDRAPTLSPHEARAACSLFLSVLFGIRVWWVHWHGISTVTGKPSQSGGNRGKKK